MVTIYLSLRAQVAVGTFFLKSLVPANQYCTDGYFFGKGSKMSAKYIKEKSQEYFMIRANYLECRVLNNSGGGAHPTNRGRVKKIHEVIRYIIYYCHISRFMDMVNPPSPPAPSLVRGGRGPPLMLVVK